MMQIAAPSRALSSNRVSAPALVLRRVLAAAVGSAVAWGYGSFLGALVHLSWIGLASAAVTGTWMLLALGAVDGARPRRRRGLA